jgi:hypothetical protein
MIGYKDKLFVFGGKIQRSFAIIKENLASFPMKCPFLVSLPEGGKILSLPRKNLFPGSIRQVVKLEGSF